MSQVGYHGHPIVKPPVWTWEVPLYFFVGGTSGMSALIAACSLAGDAPLALARAALWLALAGAMISPLLLVLDLGRPARFLNMLRVFKLRSAMSVGAWTLVSFGGFSFSSVFLYEGFALMHELGLPRELLGALLWASMIGGALSGALLATYTGVLLAVTVIPAWTAHRALLPVHFGAAGLGSAAALLELAGSSIGPLAAIGITSALAETVVLVLVEWNRHGVRDRALRRGRAGMLLRAAGISSGPLSLLLRLIGAWPLAALAFLTGSLISRYAWVAAGRASAADPEASLAG
jgi:formate-dependent nitrite reductase membrane component NrfD